MRWSSAVWRPTQAQPSSAKQPVDATSRASAAPEGSAFKKDVPAQPYPEPETQTGLFEQTETQRLRTRWTALQGGFVEEPCRAVTEANAFVARVMKRLAEVWAKSVPNWNVIGVAPTT